MNLKREITPSNLLLVSFAAIFGSGWLFAPLYAAQIAGPASLLAWLVGALISATIGITMAEVVVLFPKSGGLSQIAKLTHGEFLSLTVTLFNLLVFVILPAIEVRAVIQYMATYLPVLMSSDHQVTPLGYIVAGTLLTLITLVNVYGTRSTVALTRTVVVFKILTPLLICCSFLYSVYSKGMMDHSRLFIQPGTLNTPFVVSWSQIFQAIATSGIIFSFNGFNQATLFAGEAKNPKTAIPFAILGSLLLSGLLYLLIQYSFLMAVPASSFSQGWSHLNFTGDHGPFAGLALTLGLGWLLWVIYIDAFASPLGTAFSYASAVPRLLYSLAETNIGSRRFLKLNKHGVSEFAIVLTLILEAAAFLGLPNLRGMIALLVAAFVLCYTTAPASLLSLRKTHPDLARPFKIFWAPGTAYLSLLFSNLMLVSCGWIALRNLIVLSISLLGAYLVHSGFKKAKKIGAISIRGSEWFIFQLAGIALLGYLEEQLKLSFSVLLFWTAIISFLSLIFSQLSPQNASIRSE